MDQQLIQSLMMCFQQGLKLLQQAQGAAGADAPTTEGEPPAVGEDADGMPTPPPAPGAEDASMPAGDEPPAAEDGMGGGTLHDRVNQIERHTGLKKSAGNQGLLPRLDALESSVLGQEFDGPALERVKQLEKALGISPAAVKSSAAPDEIPLEALIKSAIAAALEQHDLRQSAPQRELPDIGSMRKAAQQPAYYGQRRSQPHTIDSDTALVKAARSFGMDVEGSDDLDAPLTFGDALLAQYHGLQAGGLASADDDD